MYLTDVIADVVDRVVANDGGCGGVVVNVVCGNGGGCR